MAHVEYHQRTRVQFDMLELEAQTQRRKLGVMVAGVRPVLDCIDMEAAPQPDDRPPRLDTIIDRCKAAWENFKSFNQDAIVSTVTHALAVVRSHYPAIDLQAIGAEFARGTEAMEHQQLEDEVDDVAKKLAGDVDLFGEMDGDGEAR